MASANYEKAQELWHSFYQDVMYHQRYFISHPILDKLKAIAEKCELTLSPGSVYYRARIIDDKAASNEHMVAKCFGENSTEETRNGIEIKQTSLEDCLKKVLMFRQIQML